MRLGGWLFKYRTSLPVPIAAALLLIPAGSPSPLLVPLGLLVVVAGELLRLLSVRQIGVISRTRSDRLGPLVATGPFARVRNPLYLGNIAVWVGFALSARLAWLAPIVATVLFAEYHFIVLWEESLLAARLGDAYRRYQQRVPRWVPRLSAATAGGMEPRNRPSFSWQDTLFSERGTLIAIAVGCLLLYVKASL